MADESSALDAERAAGATPALNLESLSAKLVSEGVVSENLASRGRALPPVESWNPPYCGDIDMRIARDGAWFYQGSPIKRPALVRLFSTILRKDPERYVLVTPVERVGIIVEDAPFVAVEMDVAARGGGQVLRFRTNVDDWIEADAEHPLRFEKSDAGGIKPYILVRGGLSALIKRALWLDIAGLGEIRTQACDRVR
jgi:hypothetical protein